MPLPNTPGLGFKPQHFADVMARPGAVGFYEVHAENLMGAGGAMHAMTRAIRQDHALSIHGVGLSIGGATGLDPDHLARVAALVRQWEPAQFSEHLAWSSHGAAWLNDLLPLPYTDETLATVCTHVDQVQQAIGRPLLLENPATYVAFAASTWGEAEFLAEVARRTGCGLLLDINNVFVSATNHRTDPRAYLAAFPLALVGQIHLAGHATEDLPSGPLLIDDHGSAVADPVWQLTAEVLARTGPRPVLVEWDTDVPPFDVLLTEAAKAATLLKARTHAA